MKSIKELLNRKRQGGIWTDDDISWFVNGVVDRTVSDAQIGAFLMAVCVQGMNLQETVALTSSMAQSGATLMSRQSGLPVVDKHSTGGVGDKVSLLLAPLISRCGIAVPMISGRGLGHTGGTVDKLESIPGMNLSMPVSMLEKLLAKHNMFIASQTELLAPADRILYAIRDVTGTVENIGLITASILSKKLAENLDGLVMDVKVGKAAFMKDLASAEDLAQSIRLVAAELGLNVHILFTRMDRPLGRTIGNWIEVVEAESALHDRGSAAPGLVEVTTELASHMLVVGKKCETIDEARIHIQRVWDSGAAHEEFHAMITRQGGDFDEGVRRARKCVVHELRAARSGYIGDFNGMTIAQTVLSAGGGRKVETDTIDPYVGVELFPEVGARVEEGETIGLLTASSQQQVNRMQEMMVHAVHIEKAPPTEEPASMIIQRWL